MPDLSARTFLRLRPTLLLGLGLAPGVASAAPAVAAGDSATIFAANIQPVFADYCVSCHGAEKTKGKLRLDSFEHLLKGGENGPAFVARDSTRSALIDRLSLQLDEEDHMPPRDKPQPPPEILKLFAGWIDQAADPAVKLADAKVPADLAPLLVVREVRRPRRCLSVVADSKDAAFVVTLSPGAYTVHVTGKPSTGTVEGRGVALVEVYLVP